MPIDACPLVERKSMILVLPELDLVDSRLNQCLLKPRLETENMIERQAWRGK